MKTISLFVSIAAISASISTAQDYQDYADGYEQDNLYQDYAMRQQEKVEWGGGGG
jgi:1,4-dihydroxy-2-naphthoate octaprenyltransferase